MLIVGKNFESNEDDINVMKVSKRYRDLSEMYPYNPISDISLFTHIETQHFYNKEDIKYKKRGMKHYVYWYCSILLRNSIGDNEKINDYYYYKLDKQILLNIETLEEWSRCMYNCVVYDSDIDGKDTMVFQNRVLNHSHLYFIVIDSHGNVFGHYHHGKILYLTTDNYYNNYNSNLAANVFLFTLYCNGISEIKKFDSKRDIGFTKIYEKELLYECGFEYAKWNYCDIFQVDLTRNCYKCTDKQNFRKIVKVVNDGIFDRDSDVQIKRIIVIEMM